MKKEHEQSQLPYFALEIPNFDQASKILAAILGSMKTFRGGPPIICEDVAHDVLKDISDTLSHNNILPKPLLEAWMNILQDDMDDHDLNGFPCNRQKYEYTPPQDKS